MDKVFLFAGPSLGQNVHYLDDEIVLSPPAKRGDIELLIEEHPKGIIVIADGIFYQHPAIGHQEIRNALEIGWSIWGVSSMGAIRAIEMGHFGMKGFGQVYNWFMNNPDFSDDEVTLLHSPQTPYFPITEPLIHIRFSIMDLIKKQKITQKNGDKIIRELAEQYFGNRTILLTSQLLKKHSKLSEKDLEIWNKNFEKYRIKKLDLLQLLNEKPWKN